MANRGVALIVLDRQDYFNKAEDLLIDKDTYRPIPGDFTSRQKKKKTYTNSKGYQSSGRMKCPYINIYMSQAWNLGYGIDESVHV